MITLLLSIWIGRDVSVPNVISSYELLKASSLSPQELSLARKHQWILLNGRDSQGRESLALAAEKLVRWRLRDLANQSPKADSQSQRALYSVWRGQLDHSPANNVANGLKDLLKTFGPEYFPISRKERVKWIKFQKSDLGKLSNQTFAAITSLFDLSSNKWNERLKTSYIRMGRESGRLDVRFMAVAENGNIVGEEYLFLKDFLAGEGHLSLATEIFPSSRVTHLTDDSITDEPLTAPVLPKDFDLVGIEKQGFGQWIAARLNLHVASHGGPTAMLVSDSDLINFAKHGGSILQYLNAKGYVFAKSNEVNLILPPLLDSAEDCKISEEQIKKINRKESSMAILSNYAKWVSTSNLNNSTECHEYVAEAIHQQLGVPDLVNYVGPLLAIFSETTDFDLFPKRTSYNLFGTGAGIKGNQLISLETFNHFSPFLKDSQEWQLGYHFGSPAAEGLIGVTVKIEATQMILFPEVSDVPMEIPMLQQYFDRYGTTAKEIIQNLAKKPVQMVASDRVNLSFASSLGRERASYFIIPRVNGDPTILENIPKMQYSSLNDMIRYWVESNDYFRSLKPPPPAQNQFGRNR